MADRRRSDQEFRTRDMIYLNLQPYRQQPVHRKTNYKPIPKYFGPFLMVANMEKVANKLQLLTRSRVYHTFHVSQFKKFIKNFLLKLSCLVQIGLLLKSYL